MTQTLAGADIRGYYAALGIELPGWARDEATVRCFAAPDAHRRDDHTPSCSVNLQHGSWRCHGCGAAGGAYDAATALGHTQRAAIDLMINHGLTERRASNRPGRPTVARPRGRPSTPDRRRGRMTVSESALAEWHAALAADGGLRQRLARERGWRRETIDELGLGLHRGRITIPVRNEFRRLVGLLHYQPWPRRGEPKMYATPGSRRQLLPHPAAETLQRVLLVEGEGDMIAARSHGLAAIALPGVRSWQPQWAELLAGRRVVIIMDADPAGREVAQRIRRDLDACADATILDLAPERDDGYDLSDWLREHGPTGEETP